MPSIPRYYIHSARQTQESYGEFTTRYMRPAGRGDYGANLGTPMMRAGSVTGVAASIFTGNHDAAGDLIAEVRVNDVVVFSATYAFVVASSVHAQWSGTQADGVDTFAAGDLIQMSLRGANGVDVDVMPIIVCEVAFP